MNIEYVLLFLLFSLVFYACGLLAKYGSGKYSRHDTVNISQKRWPAHVKAKLNFPEAQRQLERNPKLWKDKQFRNIYNEAQKQELS